MEREPTKPQSTGWWIDGPLRLSCLIGSLIPFYVLVLYVRSYGYPFPVIDAWLVSAKIATAVQEGTLSFSDLTEAHAGHRIFFTHVQTALSSYFTNWQLGVEVFINPVLALGNFALLALLFRRQSPRSTHLILIPFSLFVFSVHQSLNWTIAYQSGWHFANFFVLGAIGVLMTPSPGWRTIAGAALLGLCASFSMGQGTLVWPLGLTLLWMRGHRRFPHYLLWIGAAAVTLWLYLASSGLRSAEGTAGSWNTFDLSNPGGWPLFVVTYIGAPLALSRYALAAALGLLSLILFLLNLVYLFSTMKRPDAWRAASVWLVLTGYGAGAGLLVAIVRSGVQTDAALAPRYSTVSMMVWIGLIGAMTIATCRILADDQRRTWHRWLGRLNLLAGVVLLALYVPTQVHELQEAAKGDPDLYKKIETCLRAYPTQRAESCLGYGIGEYMTPELVYRVAVYKLSIFADDEPVSILPETYQPGSPVLINTPSGWLNMFVRDRMLPGVSNDSLFHLTRPGRNASIEDHPRPLVHVAQGFGSGMPGMLEKALDGAARTGEIWYITTPEAASNDHQVFSEFQGRNFRPVIVPLNEGPYAGARFELHRFVYVEPSVVP